MDKAEVLKKLSQYKALVSKHLDIENMILFGSYAKGNQNENSDIDVAVIVSSINYDFFTYTPLLWKLRRDIDLRIEPVLFEKNEDQSGFLQEIQKTGILID